MTRTPNDQHGADRDSEHPQVPRHEGQGAADSPVSMAGAAGAVASTGPSSLAVFMTVGEQGPWVSVGLAVVMMVGASAAVALPALYRRSSKRSGSS